MRLVSVHSSDVNKMLADKEMLRKASRPCVLVIKLRYKGARYDFAVPLRSNIAGSAPKDTFFPLPPRPTTRNGCRHGIHYIKMFPVSHGMFNYYRVEGNRFAKMIKRIIDNNEKRIVAECQAYLNRYESGDRPLYSTDIELLLSILKE